MKMLQHKFVEFIPQEIEEGTLYISIEYCTTIHKCICGCGNEVVTPLSPTDWRMTFNGKAVTLHPSIGNWSFDCQSHYWIRDNKIELADSWTKEEIRLGREVDQDRKTAYFETTSMFDKEEKSLPKQKLGFWQRVFLFFKI
ncbi:DUF6527 family protein [Sphingobacterium luzhongxinii]|uniref:DUF6527 family protein n=1 Tax=Sphingobacterium luzhongxinii TaxID=2654181 RepID=UPI001969E034|nr:DUF6527 family protein [Sphingobacterium sp. xlx-73]